MRKISRPGVALIGLFVLCMLLGPAIFFGLQAAAVAGWLEPLVKNPLIIAIGLPLLMLAWLFAILALGNRLSNGAKTEEKHHG